MQQVIISKFTETSPCFGCTKRTPFCHRIGQCELFTDWRARKDAFTRAEQAKRRGYQTARDQRSEQVYKPVSYTHLVSVLVVLICGFPFIISADFVTEIVPVFKSTSAHVKAVASPRLNPE